MQRAARWGAGILAGLLLASPVAAQAPASRGPWSVGGDLGFSNPIGDDDIDGDLTIDGFFEYAQNDSLSWRGTVGLLNFDGPPGDPGDVDILVGLGNLVYRWDAGQVWPLLTAGIGFYDYDPDFGDGSLEIGLNLGGGIEFELNPTLSLKVEGSLHGTSGPEPDSLFLLTIGVRFRL